MQQAQNSVSLGNGQDTDLSIERTKESALSARHREARASSRERTFQAVFTSFGCKAGLDRQTLLG